MTFSVWNPGLRVYEYFETSEVAKQSHAPVPRQLKVPRKHGATPEQAAWPLPAGARKVGSGPMPRGRIASRGGAPLGAVRMPSTDTLAAVAVGVGIGFVMWGRRR